MDGALLVNFPAPYLPPLAFPPLAGCKSKNSKVSTFDQKSTCVFEYLVVASVAFALPAQSIWAGQLAGQVPPRSVDWPGPRRRRFADFGKLNRCFLISWFGMEKALTICD